MDSLPDVERRGELIAFPAESARGARRSRQKTQRESVEDLLHALKTRRLKLQDRLDVMSLAIDRLEDQVAIKGLLEVVGTDPA